MSFYIELEIKLITILSFLQIALFSLKAGIKHSVIIEKCLHTVHYYTLIECSCGSGVELKTSRETNFYQRESIPNHP